MAMKKQWYEILAPKMFKEIQVGYTPASDSKQLLNRTIEVGLSEISNDYAKFYINLLFQIESVKDSKAYTKFAGYSVMSERIYRMVQKRTRRVDCIQDVKTKDNKTIRVKNIIILSRRVNTSLKDKTRAKTRKLIENISKNTTLENIVKMAIKGDLQNLIRHDCNKIYPVRDVEIRKIEVLE